MLRSTSGALVMLLAAAAVHAELGRPASPATEFVGSTPCGDAVRRFLGIANAACQQVTWELAFADDSGTGRPFELRARYHMPVPGSPNRLDAGTPLQVRGASTFARGRGPQQGRMIYTLTTDGRSLQLALLDRDLLHLLAADGRLMVGNAGWSYTLNGPAASAPRPARRMAALETIPRGAGTEVPAYRHTAGEFEGRTPCQAIATQLNLAVDAGCAKLKWRLTVFQDAATGRPTTYKYEGTLYRDGAPYGATPRTGTWGMLRDPSSGALIYRLDLDRPGAHLLLLRADENVLFFLDQEGHALVGDRSHSYTLNRAAPTD